MYDKAIKLNPYKPKYYYNKGKKYFKQLRYSLFNLKKLQEEAITMYNKAIELHPHVPIYYNNKRYSLESLKIYEEAILMQDKAMIPNNRSYSIIKDNLFIMQNYMKKLFQCIQSHRIQSIFSCVYINKGNKQLHASGYSLINLQRYDQAEIQFTNSLEVLKYK